MDRKMTFDGKVALVTGSTRGIGLEIASRLASEGCAVAITGRDEDAGSRAVDVIGSAGGRAIFIAADLGAEGQPQHIVSRCVEELGGLDILVNNAAPTNVITAHDRAVADIDVADWNAIMNGAATATLLMSQCAIPELRKAGGGAIINISTSVASRGYVGMTAHAASKAAIESLTRSLAVELGGDNIRANTVVLGFIISGPRQAAVAADPVRGGAIRSTQLLRFGTARDAAAAVAFLASDDAGFITGISLPVDGGALCRMPIAQLPGATSA